MSGATIELLPSVKPTARQLREAWDELQRVNRALVELPWLAGHEALGRRPSDVLRDMSGTMEKLARSQEDLNRSVDEMEAMAREWREETECIRRGERP